jgi:two-component system, OmpR family, phosphate regulon sensor histidine kinase PhoR
MFSRLFVPFTLVLWSVLLVLALLLTSLVDNHEVRLRIGLLFGLTAVAGTVAVAALAGSLARRLTRPVRELIEVAERISDGAVGQRVFLGGSDEVGQLGQMFNRLSERLAIRIAQLEEDRQQLRTILSGMVEGVVALDADQRILFANERASQLLEFPTPGPVGRRLWEVVRQRPLLDIVQRALDRPEPSREEFNWNGAITRSLTVHAARLPGGPARGAVLVLHDTTELRRLERLRQEFVANVSHELKTPLSVIKANVETLIDGAVDDANHRGAFLKQIASQSDRLHYLILDLISLGRIESGEERFEFQAVPVEMVAQTCIERHWARAEARQQTLLLLPPEQPDQKNVEVWADEEAVDQILDNLLDNALKYTPENGQIRVGWRLDNEQVAIEVSDTGIGIPAPDLPRIFERFYRVDKARSREMGGTGLGLSIVKHLVQAMHGTVRAVSRVGAGTTFTVLLPRAPREDPAATVAKSPPDFHRIYTERP